MTIINLKEWALERGFSNYHVRRWIKDGLPTFRQRPYLTTSEALEEFFKDTEKVRYFRKQASKRMAYKNFQNKKLDFNDYLGEEYK